MVRLDELKETCRQILKEGKVKYIIGYKGRKNNYMAIPAFIIIPYVFHKTQNTLTGVFIHGIYNGPIFVLVALGLIK